jgi:succinate dehydrogenase / fumarate reductase flavoprotein subunit
MTNVRGLYAFGEVNFAYHGATRLGANALLSCIFDGLFCGSGVVNYVREHEPSEAPAAEIEPGVYERFVRQEEAKQKRLVDSVGSGDRDDATNPYKIGRELGIEMTEASTVVKSGARLEQCMKTLASLRDRYSRVKLGDAATWTNQSLSYTRALGDMLVLAEAIAGGGLARKESRGSHFRTDYPDRDDAGFLKTTVACYDPERGETQLRFREVDTRLVKPRARTYGKVEGEGKKEEKREAVGAGAS